MAENKKHERIIELDDTQLIELVKAKGEFVEQGRTIARMMDDAQKQMDDLMGQQKSLMGKVLAHKHKVFKRLKKVTRGLLSETEIPVTTEMRDGKLVLIVSDALAEFKDKLAAIDKFSEPVPLTKGLSASK